MYNVKIEEVLLTFNVDGIDNHIVKIYDGKISYGLIKIDIGEVWLCKTRYSGSNIMFADSIGVLLNQFVDITTYTKIYCETTGLKILVSDNFIHFPNGLKSSKNGYLINVGCKACPEWEEIDTPKDYLGKVNTNNGTTYILKLSDNVHLVT